MNWRLIVYLSLLSILLAIGSIAGLVKSQEWLGWLVIGILSGWYIAGRVDENFFLYGLILGILDGILNSSLKALFFESYSSSNPRIMDAFDGLPQDLSPRMVMLIMGPLVGALLGVAFGIITAAASMLRKRMAARRMNTPE
jgi:predicted outer membrane lipoprotein